MNFLYILKLQMQFGTYILTDDPKNFMEFF